MPDLDAATALADTVLFEGYVLYPYRANDTKNQVRWQFGVLMPPAFAELDPSERAWLQTDCLLEGRAAELTVRLRFLHVRRRSVEVDGAAVSALDVGDTTFLPCDEAAVHESDVRVPIDVPLTERDVELPGGLQVEEVLGAPGARLVRRWQPVSARLHVEVHSLPGPYGVRRVRVRLDNRSPWTCAASAPPASSADRPAALARALVAAHLVVGVEGGRFVSQLDPPEWARGYVGDCVNVGCFPVLAGPATRSDLVLASPIILYDHAQVAPESEVAFCDATEMDEMLTLRAMTLTEEEKRQARGSDPRAARIVDDVDHLPPQLLDRLHGAIRSMSAVARPAGGLPDQPVEPGARPPWWDPGADASVDPDTDEVLVDGVPVHRGVQVRLRPGTKRADAQDMFLDGRLAHVEAVLNDVDGSTHLAVALDELITDGLNPHGRYLYFAPDEIEPIRQEA